MASARVCGRQLEDNGPRPMSASVLSPYGLSELQSADFYIGNHTSLSSKEGHLVGTHLSGPGAQETTSRDGYMHGWLL